MDYARSFAVSAAGMAVERTRVEVAAQNLAHAHTVLEGGTRGYTPMRAVAQAAGGFRQWLPAVALEPSGVTPRLVHEPGHPAANGQGFVAYPGVDPATEMVSLMSALRSYEANVAAMNTARTLALKTLEIGRGT